jgi:tetratricopeptide (TPR) repeat protein
VANKATCIYARFVEPSEARRLGLFMQAAERAAAHQQHDPLNPGAWYWQGYALGRFSQGISVAKALAQGLGGRVKQALQKTLELAPQHADAHLALGTFHAEVIDKVGSLISCMTYGASKETGLALYQQALRLNPDSAITLNEYANGLLMLEGEDGLHPASQLQDRAAAFSPLDAMERHYMAVLRATQTE